MVIGKHFPHTYNATAWLDGRGHVCLLGRRVTDNARREGEPDFSSLLLTHVDAHAHLSETVVWDRRLRPFLLEDPRVFENADKSLSFGFSVIRQDSPTTFVPYPAYLTSLVPDFRGELSSSDVVVLDQFGPGKNLTPVGPHLWLFRKEGHENNSKLLLLERDGKNFSIKKELDFNGFSLPWATFRIGTTVAPFPIDDTKSLLLLHGINREENNTFKYFLGRAIIDIQTWKVLEIDTTAWLSTATFQASSVSYTQLHPHREVVYVCGAIQRSEHITLYVNTGDTQTVEAIFTRDELIKGLL